MKKRRQKKRRGYKPKSLPAPIIRTEFQKRRDDLMMRFMLQAASSLLGPILKKVGEGVAAKMDEKKVEWPTELEVKENANQS